VIVVGGFQPRLECLDALDQGGIAALQIVVRHLQRKCDGVSGVRGADQRMRARTDLARGDTKPMSFDNDAGGEMCLCVRERSTERAVATRSLASTAGS
jgi:hypothetical protein